MKIVAVIPVSGRENILKITIPKLCKQVSKVITIGHEKSECEICEGAGADFYFCSTKMTLGWKWQYAIERAKLYVPDAVLIMSTGSVISDDYCETLFEDLKDNDMVGRRGMYFMDYQPKGVRRMIFWPGYFNGRISEPVGVGRMVSAKFLDKSGWALYDKKLSGSLDSSVMRTLAKYGGKVHINNDDVYSLRISSYRYRQKNSYDRLAKMPRVKEVENIDEVLKKVGL